MKHTVLAMLIAWSCCLPTAQAKESALLLVSVHDHKQPTTYWWRCDGTAASPVTERLAAVLGNANIPIIHSCKQLTAPPHRSYHRAQLRSYQRFNLANTAEATRLFSGQLRYQEHDVITQLGLFHHAATLTLTSYDVRTEQTVATVSLHGDGFGHSVEATRRQANNALLSQLTQQMPTLLAKPAYRFERQLRIRVDGLPTQGHLDPVLERVRAVQGVRRVSIDQLRRATAVLRIEPLEIRAAIESVLPSLAPDCAVTILP